MFSFRKPKIFAPEPFSGIAMHDGWKPYDMFTDCRHVLCNAHLLRDLQGIIDSTGENGQNKCRDF